MNELTAFTFHHFFMKWGIKKATFDYTKDGKIQYEYIYLSRYEFQLGKVGNTLTNYKIPEE
jgi:hypothetical protein